MIREHYHIDHERELLWIIQYKNASTSICHALGVGAMVTDVEAASFKHYHTIMVVRHAWDRMESMLGGRRFEENVEREVLSKPTPYDIDPHIWPQWVAMEGFQVDRFLCFDRVQEDWQQLRIEYDLPELEHWNHRREHDWRIRFYDRSRLMPWYGPDLEVWEKLN